MKMDTKITLTIGKEVLDELSDELLSSLTSFLFNEDISFETAALIIQTLCDKREELEDFFASQD